MGASHFLAGRLRRDRSILSFDGPFAALEAPNEGRHPSERNRPSQKMECTLPQAEVQLMACADDASCDCRAKFKDVLSVHVGLIGGAALEN